MQFIGENQRDSDCVIVATHNAAKWHGKVISYAKAESIAIKKYNYNPDKGFYTCFVSKFLNDLKIPHREVPLFTMSQLEQRLLSGNAVMATYATTGSSRGHMVLIVPGKNRTIEIVNSPLTWMDLVLKWQRRELGMRIWNLGKGNHA